MAKSDVNRKYTEFQRTVSGYCMDYFTIVTS